MSSIGIGPESPLSLKFLFHFFCLHCKVEKITILSQKFKSEKKVEERDDTIEQLFLDMKNHKQRQFDHINQLKYPNLNFHLMLMMYKNLLILFVHFSLTLLFLFIFNNE